VGGEGYQNYARGGGASSAGQNPYGGYSSSGGGQNSYYQYSGNPFGGGNGGFKFHSTGGFNQGDFSDFFQQIFGGMGGGNPFGSMSGFGGGEEDSSADTRANLSLSLHDAYNGGRMDLTLPGGKSVKVKLPAKITDGATIKLKGYGDRGGDLYVTVKITPQEGFRLEGEDIYQTLAIMPWTAALGGQTQVSMPDGSSVKIKIPAGIKKRAENETQRQRAWQKRQYVCRDYDNFAKNSYARAKRPFCKTCRYKLINIQHK
jgi:curved DNA-binding protein